jgi:hypothetical protein
MRMLMQFLVCIVIASGGSYTLLRLSGGDRYVRIDGNCGITAVGGDATVSIILRMADANVILLRPGQANIYDHRTGDLIAGALKSVPACGQGARR